MVKITNLNESEKQVLDAVLSLELHPKANPEETDENTETGQRLLQTFQNLLKRGALIQVPTFEDSSNPVGFTTSNLIDWANALPSLLDAGLLYYKDRTYNLADNGRDLAKQARTERIGRRFSLSLVRSARSTAHAEFCERVFGLNLCQADMMDMEQLEVLLDVLKLSGDNKVLDLACGIGAIAEYISDATGAYVLGVDIAVGAISFAQERTKGKRVRLEFQYGDMNNLDIPPASFDTVIAVASLHYAEDLDETIRQLKHILTPGGQLGLFTFQYASDSDPPDILNPENTDLGCALRNHSLEFQTWDFTESEISIRRKQIQAAMELFEAFRGEGNLALCEDRIEECEIDLPHLEAGMKRRYLYHARLQ
jgi:SAM-dependent methyltransferase